MVCRNVIATIHKVISHDIQEVDAFRNERDGVGSESQHISSQTGDSC